MKLSIRNIAFSALLTIGSFTAITYTACNKDECKDVVCQNGGTCVAGTCACSTGYEGTNCQTLSRDKFIGTWAVSETCDGTPSTPYQVTITAGTNPNEVLISNLGNYNCTIGGTITYNGSVNMATITVNDNKCSTQMNATGNYANGKITFTYSATYGVPATTDNCSATLQK